MILKQVAILSKVNLKIRTR